MVGIGADGLLTGAPHAQHIHLQPGRAFQCPTMADAGDDGALSVAKGQPAYGPIQIPLTTEGDFGAGSALAVDRFPVANAQCGVSYARAFELPQKLADQLRGQTRRAKGKAAPGIMRCLNRYVEREPFRDVRHPFSLDRHPKDEDRSDRHWFDQTLRVVTSAVAPRGARRADATT